LIFNFVVELAIRKSQGAKRAETVCDMFWPVLMVLINWTRTQVACHKNTGTPLSTNSETDVQAGLLKE
jgi:hypothetical protein